MLLAVPAPPLPPTPLEPAPPAAPAPPPPAPILVLAGVPPSYPCLAALIYVEPGYTPLPPAV